MGRKAVEVKTLHGYTIEQLKDIREKTDDGFKKEIILIIIMRYNGIQSEDIENILGKSRPTILRYIHNWNNYGLEATKDHRGGSIGSFTDEMKDDLLKTLVGTKPVDPGFNSHSWTCNLLAKYIKNKYDIQYPGEWIRRIIKAENFTYKKAQRKSSLAKESEQLAFKKIKQLLNTVENSSEIAMYALDETYVRNEPNNYRSWSPKGKPLTLESNGSHKGVNVIGATEILSTFETYADVYSHKESITSSKVQKLLDRLLEENPTKKVYVILDNAKSHKSIGIQAFSKINAERLELIYLPLYSPELNPQENVWSRVKSIIHQTAARCSEDKLFNHFSSVYQKLNSLKDKMKSIVHAKNFYK